MIEFGRNWNQVFHTFRHVEAAGLQRVEVEIAIRAQLWTVEQALHDGPLIGEVQVKGVLLEFRAYKFSNGDIHVGRITPR